MVIRVRNLAAVVVLVGLCAVGPSADACCMVPLDYGGDVDQSAQQVALWHHEGHQELVVRVSPFFQGVEELPGYLAWVLTVPSKPMAYAVASRGIFDEARDLHRRLQDMAASQEARRSKFSNPFPGATVDGAALLAPTGARGLDVSAPIRVGPYEITEVKARGAEALDALNDYLKERAFPQEDPAHMRWFVENDFTFLCIYILPPEGQSSLGKTLDLEPLQIGFKTPEPYYPGMFSSQQGNFGLKLTAFTSKPVARASLRSIRKKLHARTGTYDNLWTEQPLADELSAVTDKASALASVPRWHVNRLSSRGFNAPDRSPRISEWDGDVYFALGGAADQPPSWYYGDRAIGWPERFWREHRYAALVWLLLIGVGFLGVRALVRRGRAT